MNRRDFLRAMSVSVFALALPVQAQYSTAPGMASSPTGVSVVFLANFYCNRCRVANDHIDRLRTAANSQGIDFRFAPIAWEGQSIWPDRIYYAAKDLYPAAEGLVRTALFDGLQRDGMLFESLPQVIGYFERRQLPARVRELAPNFSLAALAERASSDAPLLSEVKAGRLADLSGASAVPTFVWVQDGNVTQVLSPANATEPVALIQLVMRALQPNQ